MQLEPQYRAPSQNQIDYHHLKFCQPPKGTVIAPNKNEARNSIRNNLSTYGWEVVADREKNPVHFCSQEVQEEVPTTHRETQFSIGGQFDVGFAVDLKLLLSKEVNKKIPTDG